MDLPISFVDVQASACHPKIGLGPVSLWTTVQVTGDVASMTFPGTSGLAPLDTIILLDFVSSRKSSTTFAKAHLLTEPQPSVNFLSDVTLSCSILASNFILNHDRLALAYVDEGTKSSFEILLSLGFHSLDAVRCALNLLSRRHYLGTRKASPDLGRIIQLAAGLFNASPRTAFCHIFFISATAHAQMMLPPIDSAIGFHTVTPQHCLPLHYMNHQPGWHISYGIGNEGHDPKGTHFIRKVAKVVRQLRTGIRPGAINNVKLFVIPAGGCYIQTDQSDSLPNSLRAGETWDVPVRVGVPAMCPYTSLQTEQYGSQPHSPIVQDLIAQINGVLMEYTAEVNEPILTALVQYHHSLLPSSNVTHVKTHLTLVRSKHVRSKQLSDADISGTDDGFFSA